MRDVTVWFLRLQLLANCAQITSLFLFCQIFPTGFPFRLFKAIRLVNAIRRKTNRKICKVGNLLIFLIIAQLGISAKRLWCATHNEKLLVQIVIQGDNTSAMKCDFQTNCGAVNIPGNIFFAFFDSHLFYKDDYVEEEEMIGRHFYFYFYFYSILSLFPLLNHIFSETATPPHSSNIKSRKWFLFWFLIFYRLSGRN
jgi:hypothetical protein